MRLSMFDPEFRQATVLAMAAAKKAGSAEINQEHLLVGLLAEPAGLAGRLLQAVSVDLAGLSAELRQRIGPVNPAQSRPRLGSDAAKAIRDSGRHTRTRGQPIDAGHLLIGLTVPFSGWARDVLKRAGVTHRGLKAAHRSGVDLSRPGLDSEPVAWIWGYLPQTGRWLRIGEEAQAAGNVQLAIEAFEKALDSARGIDDLPGAAGDIYPKLIQACLLAGERERAFRWLDEAEEFTEGNELSPDDLPQVPSTREWQAFTSEVTAAHATMMLDLRLQVLKDRAHLLLADDDFGRAADAARALIAAGEGFEHPTAIAAGRYLLGQALSYQGGADDEADALLRSSLEPAELIEPIDRAARTVSIARHALYRGDLDRAADLAEIANVMYTGLGRQWSAVVARLIAAEVAVLRGDAADVKTLQSAVELDPSGTGELHPWALRIDAMGAKHTDPAGARAKLGRAIDMVEQHNLRLTQAHCLLERGRIEARHGETDAARASFEQARQVSQQIGVRFAADADTELMALG